MSPSSVWIITSVAFTKATTRWPSWSPSSSALSRVMRATILLPSTSRDTFAAASPLTTSVIVPGSLLRVLSAIVVPPLRDRAWYEARVPRPGAPYSPRRGLEAPLLQHALALLAYHQVDPLP